VRHVNVYDSVPPPQHNSPMENDAMENDARLGTLVNAACEQPNLPTRTDGATPDVATHNGQTDPPMPTDGARHNDSIVTKDNLESAQQHCSHSTSSSTPTAKPTKTISCNRRINNVETRVNERCSKTPVVYSTKKLHYCEEHNVARLANNRANYLRSKNVKVKEEEDTNTEHTKVVPPSSMSMLCAVSEDGFFLDIFPKSHRQSYFKNNDENNPIHFSASERIHVPQTYMILLHKFLFHCGSAVPDNGKDQTRQQRLFAYVTTEFLKTTAQGEQEYKNLMSKNRTSDIPTVRDVHRKPYLFCCKQNSKTWLCDSCDKDKVMSREKLPNPQNTTEWDKTVPGTVVAGDMKKLGYVIIRTSLTKLECPYILAMESSMSDWENISSKGNQDCDGTCQRQQFALEKSQVKKGIKNVCAIPFVMLRKDILKMDPSMAKAGYWTQGFEHKKMLRNLGPCPKQYPHADYDFLPVRFRRKKDAKRKPEAINKVSKRTKEETKRKQEASKNVSKRIDKETNRKQEASKNGSKKSKKNEKA
jgi:hypothetical protein